MDVSIIIVNYNTKALTLQCIDSIYRKTERVSYEIIVVDNASSDGSAAEIRKLYLKVIVITSDVNLGFGKANNLGAERATGKYLFLLNSDTLLVNNAIHILFHFLESHSNVGVCGGNLFNKEMKLTHSHVILMPGLLDELNSLFLSIPLRLLYGNKRNYNPTKAPLEVAYVTGADLMISRSLFEKLNGFDPDFFMYYEETELCLRVKNEDLQIINVPDSEIIHLEGSSFSFSENRERMFLHSKRLFMEKKGGKFYRILCDILYSCSSLLRFFVSIIFCNKRMILYWGLKFKLFFCRKLI